MPDADGRFRLSMSVPDLPWKRDEPELVLTTPEIIQRYCKTMRKEGAPAFADAIEASRQRVAEQDDLAVRRDLGLAVPKQVPRSWIARVRSALSRR